jgi:hypothetical protein
MGFIVHKSELASEHEKTGKAIVKVSKSAFKNTPKSEWKKFDGDIRKWLYDNGYRYTTRADGQLAPGSSGKIPDNIDIVPVYDTPTRMHVRIPWAGDLSPPPVPKNEPYSPVFTVFLARYFMRKCR